MVKVRPAMTPMQLVTSPCALLVHLGGITLGSILVPVIAAHRIGSSRTSSSSSKVDDVDEGAYKNTDIDSRNQPASPLVPSKYQLLALSSLVRKQLAVRGHPFDGVFTIRNLNMYTHLPQLAVPTGMGVLPPGTVRPEKWIWRLPATAAINSIIRRVRSSSADERTRRELLPIAVVLAQNALHWDMLIWTATLYNRGMHERREWDACVARIRGLAGGYGLQEEVSVPIVLPQVESSGTLRARGTTARYRRQAHVHSIWNVRSEAMSSADSAVQPRMPGKGDYVRSFKGLLACPLPSASVDLDVQPKLSLPMPTLDALFRALVDFPVTEDAASSAVSLTLAVGSLRRPTRGLMSAKSFKVAASHDRIDLAARVWSDYWDSSRSHSGRTRHLHDMTDRLAAYFRLVDKRSWGLFPRETLSALAIVVTVLEREWASLLRTEKLPRGLSSPDFTSLLVIVSSCPAPPVSKAYEPDTQTHRDALLQAQVSEMAHHLVRRIVGDVLGVEWRGNTYLSARAQAPSPASATAANVLPSVQDYNILIAYTLNHLDLPDVASQLLDAISGRGLQPTAATHSTVLKLIAPTASDLERAVEAWPEDHYIASRAAELVQGKNDPEALERLVFRILPELDFSGEHQLDKLRDVAMPRRDRPLEVYMSLLSALVAAHRVGLAERVFRLARRAAELSREQAKVDICGASRPWILPARAFELMIRLYAREAKRGRAFERRQTDDGQPHPMAFVEGWGRDALRVAALNDRREKLAAELGGGQEAQESARRSIVSPRMLRQRISGISKDSNDVPRCLRSEAAPIVAVWELEGGSKEPELANLRRAMGSVKVRKALHELFPGSIPELGTIELRRLLRRGVRERGKRDPVKERMRVRSLQLAEKRLTRSI